MVSAGSGLIKQERPSKTFAKSLEKHWGELISGVKAESGSQRGSLNPLTYSALCASRPRRLVLTHDENKLLTVQNWVPGCTDRCRGCSGYCEWTQRDNCRTRPSLKFTEQIVQHLRVLALYKRLCKRSVHHSRQFTYCTYRGADPIPAPFSPAYFQRTAFPSVTTNKTMQWI